MKNHIPSYKNFINEKSLELNETGFKAADMQKTIDYIKKEVGTDPGYAFFGDDEDIEDFNKYWNAKKYKDAFDVMAVASNMELDDFNAVKKILSESKVNEGKEKDLQTGKKYTSQYGEVFFVRLHSDGKTMILWNKDMGNIRTSTSNAGGMKLVESTTVNEGAVKAFEKDYKDMESNIKKGMGWIDPEYVADTWENSSDTIDYELVKGELLKRLEKAGLLWHSGEDEDTKGKQVKFSELVAYLK
jgi:hypothetical protein